MLLCFGQIRKYGFDKSSFWLTFFLISNMENQRGKQPFKIPQNQIVNEHTVLKHTVIDVTDTVKIRKRL